MSRDRVRFYLCVHRLNTKLDDVFYEAFGQRISSKLPKHYEAEIEIICRPSQFARFLILRNEAGLQNQFKELKPELFVPEDSPVLDVSANPNRVRIC